MRVKRTPQWKARKTRLKNRIAALRREGYKGWEICQELTLSEWELGKLLRSLITEGRVVRSPRGRIRGCLNNKA